MRILLSWPRGSVTGTLADTPTAQRLLAALPVRGKAQCWGDEVYFHVPLEARLEADACDVVPPGTLCYWVEGASLALPFGPTPVSRGDECRLVTRVNQLGRIDGDPRLLASIAAGDTVEVTRLDGAG
ncbi:MAG TPA: cyclophilin-like fold protein [Gammaproteobacteria bacterium]